MNGGPKGTHSHDHRPE